jgi:hypothetical protein
MPREGIDFQSLAAKFSDYIDETNVALFTKLATAISESEMRLWLKPLDRLPPETDLNEIIDKAKKPALPEPKFDEKKYEVTSRHIGEIIV